MRVQSDGCQDQHRFRQHWPQRVAEDSGHGTPQAPMQQQDFRFGETLVAGEHWQQASNGARILRRDGTDLGQAGVLDSPPVAPPPQFRRVNEDGDSVPGSQASQITSSQDSDLARRTRRSLDISATASQQVNRGTDSGTSSRPEGGQPNGGVADDRAPRRRPLRRDTAALRREIMVAPPPPPVAPAPSAFVNGVVTCPWCAGSTFQTIPGFMRHLSTVHAGAQLDEPLVDLLRLCDRGVCTDRFCGAFRRLGTHQCQRPASAHESQTRSTSLRTPVVGDMVPGPLGVSPPESAARRDPVSPPGQARPRDALVDVELPDDFQVRVQHLPPQTNNHIPISMRPRHTRIWADCLEGVAAKLKGWCWLEEARSRLLLADCLQGAHRDTELAVRLSMWERGAFVGLLARCEMQLISRRSSQAQRRRAVPNHEKQAKRRKAKQQVAEGAYRKALTSLTSELARFTHEDEVRWAGVLLPASGAPDVAFSTNMDTQGVAAGTVQQHRQQHPTTEGDQHPLSGVRYTALTAPGPTGTRPEHCAECLGIRQKPLARRLARAMRLVQQQIEDGTLCEHARWILRTRLVFLRKPDSDTPRPIRIGEFLRTSTAKRMIKRHVAKLRPKFLQTHQWGIDVPGGAEALVHWRSTTEALARSGRIDALVAFDIDLTNMFGSLEWPRIRESIQRHFEEAAAWTNWQHKQTAEVQLPGGGVVKVNRGAEQGDPQGPVQSTLTLGDAVLDARRKIQDNLRPASGETASRIGASDEWFIDDGQAFVKPSLADLWLRTLDEALVGIGACRSVGSECKSVARLVCPVGDEGRYGGWDTPYIRSTCRVLDSSEPVKVLGAMIGSDAATTARMLSVCEKTRKLRDAIADIDHPPTELILTRRCLDVSKLSYLLRCDGDTAPEIVLHKFDQDMRESVEDTLGGRMGDLSWLQAALGVQTGGLGLREAEWMSLPSFIASRIASRPLVMEMAQHLVDAGLATLEAFRGLYDSRTQGAVDTLREQLPEDMHASLQLLLDDETDIAAQNWDSFRRGRQPHGDTQNQQEGADSRPPGSNIVIDAGAEDPEHSAGSRRFPSQRVQHKITALLDQCLAQGLVQAYTSAESWEDVRRLDELSHPDCSHEWLWATSQNKSSKLGSKDFVTAVRLRLGAAGPDEPSMCGLCGKATIGSNGAHCLLCAKGQSTKGHNNTRDELFSIASALDPNTECEPLGLIDSRPQLRPADVLTSATSDGRLTALDVGVISPDATGAGEDCVTTMTQRKMQRYQPFADALEANGVRYQPVVWSAYGRPSTETVRLIRSMARRAARRNGLGNESLIARRYSHRLTVELWRRAARMVTACMEVVGGGDDGEIAPEEVLVASRGLWAGDPSTLDGSVGPPVDGAR